MPESSIPLRVLQNCVSLEQPSYIYDLDQLRCTAETIQSAFKNQPARILFATMANPRAEILETLAGLGVGACVNSVLHLKAALRAGMLLDRIQVTSSGLSVQDFCDISATRTPCNVDSLGQAEVFMSASPGAAFGARINKRLLVNECLAAQDRLGMSPSDVPALVSLAHARGSRLNGLHIYVGTNFESHSEMMPAINSFFKLAESVPTLDYVNIGGGMGVDYTLTGNAFDISAYATSVGERLDVLKNKLHRQIQLVVEPGRAMVAACGYFTCRVTDVKRLAERIFVGVNASVAQFPRPWHHPETPHRVYATKALLHGIGSTSNSLVECIVAGRTTYSKDILSTGLLPSDIAVGDSLVFTHAGAYSDSMASRFLGQPEPASIFLN